MSCCPHTPFQHLGGAGRCTVGGCVCPAYCPAPDPAEVARSTEAARQARIARLRAQRAAADAELRSLGEAPEPEPMRDTIAAYLRNGAEFEEIIDLLDVSERQVQRIAVAIGLSRGRGRPPGGARLEAIRLYKEGVAVAEIAQRLGRWPSQIARFLEGLTDGAKKIDK